MSQIQLFNWFKSMYGRPTVYNACFSYGRRLLMFATVFLVCCGLFLSSLMCLWVGKVKSSRLDKLQWVIVVPRDYSSIQKAVDAASAGDVIYVRSGVYHERISVYVSDLVIVGEDCRSTVIDGGGDGPVVQISGSNVTFMNFTIRNGGSRSCVEISAFANFSSNRVLRSQIGVHMNARSIVMRNYISGCGQGILLYMCSSVRVESNILSGNTVGISLNEAHNNSILNNTVQESVEGGHGITILSKSFNNSILGNLIWNNSHGMWLSGDSQNNLIAENTISKK